MFQLRIIKNHCLIYLHVMMLFFVNACAVGEPISIADEPENYYDNIIKNEKPGFKFSADIYKGLDKCLSEAGKLKAEFLYQWDKGRSTMQLRFYEGNKNYLYEFSDDAPGGGFICFVSKNDGAIIKNELQY